jgi:tRNA nucleotidyltransferase (CCA-adding enzyme)
LRAVGDAPQRFTEDALRILRGVRFAVKYGLRPEENTLDGMFTLAQRLQNIAAERIFDELCKLLPLVTAQDLLVFAPILGQIIPELRATMGFDQHNTHHAYDIFTHTAYVVESVPADLALRWAALLHDIGKVDTFTMDAGGQGHFYGHAAKSEEMADAILRQLKAPTALRERVVFLIHHHMTSLPPDRKILRRRLSQFGQEAVWQLLALQRADFGGKGVFGEITNFDEVEAMLHTLIAEDACLRVKDLAVTGKDLMAIGFPAGPQLGQCLNSLLDQVLDETLPNEKYTLMECAAAFLGK